MFFLHRAAFKAAFVFFVLLGFSFPAYTASFQVTPVRAVFDADNKSSIFEFVNSGEEDVSVQVEVMKWSQVDGQDQFESTNDFIVVPKIIKLEPNNVQIARLGLFNSPVSDKESSYRIFFTEILSSQQLEKANNISMRLRISIPIFVQPDNEVIPDLQIEDFSMAAEASYLELSNSGSQHVQLLNLQLASDSGDVLEQSVSVYLLPGQQRKLLLDIPAGTVLNSINVETDTAGILTYTFGPSE